MYQMSDDLLKLKTAGVVTTVTKPVILSGVFRSGAKEDATKDLAAIAKDSSLRKSPLSLRFATLRMTPKDEIGVRE
jgi:hypothetical protein